ncbi:SpoIIE family protein phosphatase, partial [Lysinibacillus sp. D4A3_S15]|uniref:SpoIIE family protein phosphatase n=1 Tax=Lysinibacillus sp. D4A3_S15 TaxID=2941227 RepID=UPI0020BDE436
QNIFSYDKAGHEPALRYRAKQDEFIPLEAKGVLLGVLSETKYTFHEIVLEEDDLIIMMTDGVT